MNEGVGGLTDWLGWAICSELNYSSYSQGFICVIFKYCVIKSNIYV